MELLENAQVRLVLAGLAVALVAGALYVLRANRRGTRRTIRVVGVGGGGANAVDAVIRAGLKGVEFVAVNSDLQALNRSSAGTRVAIGRSTTHGLGAGGNVTVGDSAAREAGEAIGRALTGSELVVIVAGLGGGTGSGAAPVIAEIARGQGALTVAVVTTPFAFEGSRRAQVAQDAAAALAGLVDAVATIPNDQVRDVMPADVTVEDAFRAIDDALHRSVAEIVDLVAVPGRINLDFADVRAVLRGGAAAVGLGRATGENRATEATRMALAATLLEGRLQGASSVLVNVSGSRKLRLSEVDAVVETVLAASGRETNLMFGVSLNPRLRDEVHVTLIATGAGAVGPVSVPVKRASVFETETLVAEPAETEATEAERLDASSDVAAASDPGDWRPVWLRRSTPASTPAPESSPGQRSQARKSSAQRSRRHRRDSPNADRAPRPDEGL
jgi:cell division protein FtsZ